MRALICLLLVGCAPVSDVIDANIFVDSIGREVVATPYCEATTTQGIYDCLADVQANAWGGTVKIMPGRYFLNQTVDITHSNIRIEGSGRGATYVAYTGPEGGTLFRWRRTGQWSIPRGSIANLFMYAPHKGTAIHLIDAVQFKAENVSVQDFDIGLHIQGRDSLWFDEIFVKANRPVLIEANGFGAHSDHTHFSNAYFIETLPDGTQGHGIGDDPIVEIAGDCQVWNLLFDGDQSWVGGNYGLYWPSGDASATSGHITIENMRREQQSYDGYSVYISRPQGRYLRHFSCRGCAFGYESNAVYVDGVDYPSVVHGYVDLAPGKVFMTAANYREIWLQSNIVVERP